MRANACPARRPAESSALHYFARSGPTKEAHRRAMNRSGGLLRSGASDQRKRAEAGDHRSPTPRGTHQGGIRGVIGEPIRGESRGPRNCCAAVRMAARNCLGNSTTGTVLGPKSASARPGPCTRPRSADALTRRGYHPARERPGVKLVRPRPPIAGQLGTAQRRRAACGRSSLTPGRAGWSR